MAVWREQVYSYKMNITEIYEQKIKKVILFIHHFVEQ